MYNQAIAGGKVTDFFLIDRITQDESLRFRQNFDPLPSPPL